jgi:hypothetical protein
MKAKALIAPVLAVSALALAFLSQPSSGQPTAEEEAALAAIVADLTAQQATMSDNQTKIDAKLATIAENVRVARIFVSRGGGKAK